MPGSFAATGQLDAEFDPSATSKDGYVLVAAVQLDGKIVVGGRFSKIGAVGFNNIGRIDADGLPDAGFNPGSGTNGDVQTAIVLADGKILIGGSFTLVNGIQRNRIARLNANGSLDTSFDPGAGADGVIICMALLPDGHILAGGLFASFGGQPSARLAKIQPGGGSVSPAVFDVGSGPNDFVETVAVQADGQILIGGAFSSVNGSPRSHIARLNPNGSNEGPGTFNSPAVDKGVFCLVLQPDGKILVGGNFLTIGGAGPSSISRLNTDGSRDGGFILGSGTNGHVNSIALQSDGKILIGGQFNSLSGEYHGSIARLSSSGAVEGSSAFDPGFGTSDGILSVSLQADGGILLGGDFTTFDGNSRKNLARLSNDAASDNLTVPDFSRIFWARDGSAPELPEVSFELSRDGGGSYAFLGAGVRITGGVELTGLELPANGIIRARGRSHSGYNGAASSFIEKSLFFSLPNTRLALDLSSSNLTAFLDQAVNFSLTATAPGNPALSYTLDFGDGSPPASGAIVNGATMTFAHPYTVPGDYTVTAAATDGTASASQSVMETIVSPSSGGAGIPNVSQSGTPVTNPLNSMQVAVIKSSGGLVQLSIDVDALTRAAPLYFVYTAFGDVAGHASIEPGTTPVHKFTQHGIFIAEVTAIASVDGTFAGKARKTLTISAKEVGETTVPPLGPVSPNIVTKTLKGKFVFNASKADTVTYSGMIKLPSGIDTSKPHEFSIAIGNIVVNTILDTKGAGKATDGSKLLKKLKVAYLKVKKGSVTAGGEDAKVDVTFTAAGLVASGFDTEGISPQGAPAGSKTGSNRNIQVAMLLDGVPYEAQVPVIHLVSKKSDLGTIAGPAAR